MWRSKELSIFQRASVCNVFLVAKLIYILQVLPCLRKFLHAFHRVFATTIWCSTFERMRRDNLFRKVQDGGVGLQHLFVKQIVMRWWYFRCSHHPILAAVKRAIAYNYMPQIYVGPHEQSMRLTGFYKEVVDSFSFLRVRFSLEHLFSVSRKALTTQLVDMLFPLPVYRQIPPDFPGHDVLIRVKKMPIKPLMKTFFFKLHTSTLPVKTWLEEKGIFVPWSVNCRFCKVPETIEHIFLHCTEALFFWDDLQIKVLKRRLLLNPHTMRFLPLPPNEVFRYDIVMLVAMYCLWKLRMADRNEEPLVPPMQSFKVEIAQLRLATMRNLVQLEWLEYLFANLSSV